MRPRIAYGDTHAVRADTRTVNWPTRVHASVPVLLMALAAALMGGCGSRDGGAGTAPNTTNAAPIAPSAESLPAAEQPGTTRGLGGVIRLDWDALHTLSPQEFADVVPLAVCELMFADDASRGDQLRALVAAHAHDPQLGSTIGYVARAIASLRDSVARLALLTMIEGYGVRAIDVLLDVWETHIRADPQATVSYSNVFDPLARLLRRYPQQCTRLVPILRERGIWGAQCADAVGSAGRVAQEAVLEYAVEEGVWDDGAFQRNVVSAYGFMADDGVELSDRSLSYAIYVLRNSPNSETRGWVIIMLGDVGSRTLEQAIATAAENDASEEVRELAASAIAHRDG